MFGVRAQLERKIVRDRVKAPFGDGSKGRSSRGAHQTAGRLLLSLGYLPGPGAAMEEVLGDVFMLKLLWHLASALVQFSGFYETPPASSPAPSLTEERNLIPEFTAQNPKGCCWRRIALQECANVFLDKFVDFTCCHFLDRAGAVTTRAFGHFIPSPR